MDCDNDEAKVTQRMYADKRERRTLVKLLEECERGDYAVVVYGDEVKTLMRALSCYGKAIKKAEELESMIDIDAEPDYWYKEKYSLGNIREMLGICDKHKTKSLEKCDGDVR